MSEIHKTVSEKLALQILPCPFCERAVRVTDCGYSSFNPGRAECVDCKRKWSLGCVNDHWDAGKIWNKLQPLAVELERLELRVAEIRKAVGLPTR